MRWPIRFLIFAVTTGVMLAIGVVPFRPGLGSGGQSQRVLIGALEAIWWLGAAWLLVGLLRAFLVLGAAARIAAHQGSIGGAYLSLGRVHNRRRGFRSAGERPSGDLRRCGNHSRSCSAELARRCFLRHCS